MFFFRVALLLALGCLSVEARIVVPGVLCPSPGAPVAYTVELPAPTQQIIYTSENTLLHLSDDHSVLYSKDTGRTWDSVPRLLDHPIRNIVVAPDKKTVVFLGFGDKKVFVSRNGGSVLSTNATTPEMFVNLQFHPYEPGWVLAFSLPGCRQEQTCSQDLYFSEDGGVHWAKLRTYVEAAYWHDGETGRVQNIVVRERKIKSGNQYWQRGQVDLTSSDGLFLRGNVDVLVSDIVASLAVKNHIFVAKIDSKGGYQLWSSDDMGQHFFRVRFSEGLDENSYSILDLSEGSAFIMAAHGNNWGNVYAGDSFNEDFTLSLRYNAKSAPGRRPFGTDFRPFRGIEGIYIANVWTKISADQEHGTLAQTVISYDKGGEWQALAPPENMKELGERLNLLGPAEESGGFYTRAEAIGIMFASGQVGTTLSTDPNTHGLYVTRDAGWTWKHVANGSHTYEITNKGAFVVAALDEQFTGSFQYSLTEGTEWFNCPLFKEGITTTFDVENIVSDPALDSRHFVLYGESGNKGYVSVLDFTETHERECSEADYELWEPSDRDGDECILGRRVTYKRRKVDATCFLPANFDTKGTFIKNCPCTYENYICEYCFVRLEGEKCVHSLDPECAGSFVNITCTPGLSYEQTQGYRRVPGDTCDVNLPSSLNLLPKNFTCDPPSAISSPGGLVVLVLVVVLVVVVGVSWYFAGTNEAFRSTLTNCIPEKFLPDRRDNVPDAHYSQLSGADSAPFVDEPDAIDSDARELNLGESTSSSDTDS